MHWFGAADPEPGSGLAGYSYLFDASPSSIPDEFIEADGDATSASVPFVDGLYWFHIRAADAAGRSGKSNWGETVHYGPILVETGPPIVESKPVLVGADILVTFSENNMQNADSPAGYIFSGGMGVLDTAVDISGTTRTFLLRVTNPQPYVIFSMTITDEVTDSVGNRISGQKTFTLNDDDFDGMADD
jgi:hypothetical protein